MTGVPFFSLQRLHAELRPQLDRDIARVLDGGAFVLGHESERFESDFANYCGVNHAVGVGNGLDALVLILRGLGIGRGDEVIVPGHTFIATWLAVSQVGATIVPVDVDLATYNIDVAKAADAITPNTRAILAVHLYGRLADVEGLARLASRRNLALIEDSAQAHGAALGARRAGSFGTAAAFSFYPAKNLGALGDGGAITTNDEALADRVRRLRNYGSQVKYVHEAMGINSRLDELQAAVLGVKLVSLDAKNRRRREIARRYAAGLADAPDLVLPTAIDDSESVWHLYVVRHPRRGRLQDELTRNGIGTLIHYPTPPHRQLAYAGTGLEAAKLPHSDQAAAEVLSLPMWPEMTDDEVQMVIDRVREASFATARDKVP